MKTVYIICVTWNGMKWIDKCLDSIRASEYPVSTIVIDNNSSDKTPNYIEEHYQEVILVRKEENWGFGKANNLGMKIALENGADYCFLLNQDAYLQPNTIGNLLKIAEAGDYGIVAPVHLNGEGDKVDLYFRDFVLTKSPEYLQNAILKGNQTIFESPFIPAAGWLLPKKTMMEIGGFDALFYHYGEDDNYCIRCLYHHRPIVFTTTAYILHDRENTVGNQSMYNRKLAFRHIVQDCADITKSFGEIFQKQGRQFYDECGLFWMYLFTGRWQLIHNFVWDYIQILIMTHQFKKSRALNRTLGPNWISRFP